MGEGGGGMLKPISLKRHSRRVDIAYFFMHLIMLIKPTWNQSWFPDSVLLQETAPIWFSVLN